MNDDQSRVEAAQERLYSRTRYHDPSDARGQVLGEREEVPANESWQSDSIDSMLASDRRYGERRSFLRSGLNRIFLIALGFFVLALAAAGYIYFAGANFISSRNVDVSVRGPVTVAAGGVVDLDIVVANRNNADIQNANLGITYPDGSRDPQNTTKILTHANIDIGVVKSGGEVTKTIHAVIFGEQGEVKELGLNLDYQVTGSSATFNKQNTFDITVGSVPVTIKVDAPSTVTSGNTFTTRLALTTNSTDVLKDVILKADYPYGFNFVSASPAATDNKGNTWDLGDLAPGDSKVITIKGQLTGQDAEERTFRFSAGIADSKDSSALGTALSTISQTVAISRPSVGLDVTLNGDSSDTYIAPAGRLIQGSINFTNNMPDKLTHARVVAKLVGTALDRFSVQSPSGGFYDSANNQIVWDENALPALASLSAGDTQNLAFQFSSLATLAPGAKNQEIDLTIEIDGTGADRSNLTVSQTRAVKIASQVTLLAKSLYSRGPFKNTGPIPPRAEKPTTYTVTFDAKNTQNDIFKPTVTATLGPNVTWLNNMSPSSETVTYNDTDRTVTWQFDKLTSGTGFSTPAKEVSFQVSLSPSIGQIGSAPILLNNLALSGQDIFTNTPIRVTLPPVTTKFDQDPSFVQGDEIVKK